MCSNLVASLQPVLFTFCACNELFFASLYMLHFTPGYVLGYQIGVWHLVAVATFPLSFLKQVVSLVQLLVACGNIGALDQSRRTKARSD